MSRMKYMTDTQEYNNTFIYKRTTGCYVGGFTL